MAVFTGTPGVDPLSGTSESDTFEKLGSGADIVDGWRGACRSLGQCPSDQEDSKHDDGAAG